MKAKFWRTIGARTEEVPVKRHQHCQLLDGWGHQCYMPAAFILAWTINNTGLPDMGEQHHEIVCLGQVGPRLHSLKDHVSHITVTPYKEIP